METHIYAQECGSCKAKKNDLQMGLKGISVQVVLCLKEALGIQRQSIYRHCVCRVSGRINNLQHGCRLRDIHTHIRHIHVAKQNDFPQSTLRFIGGVLLELKKCLKGLGQLCLAKKLLHWGKPIQTRGYVMFSQLRFMLLLFHRILEWVV